MNRNWMAGLLLGLALQSIAATGKQSINLIFVDVDSTPFLVGRGDRVANPPGLAVELIQQAVAAAGYQLQLQRLPQLRMLRALEEGKVDGAFIFSYTPERAQLYVYPMIEGQPDPNFRVTHISYRLYRLKGSRVTWDGQKFEGMAHPVGVNTGWVMANTLRDKGLAVDDGGRGYPENFSKLKLGRISAYATLEPSAESYLKSTGMADQFEKVGPPLQDKDYFLLFSKRFMSESPDVARRIWQMLAQVREKQEAALFQKYEDVAPQ
ncbi:transporter substrate-binding domain-containing protein [Chitinivorax sp. B]|uniref:substrate-binding periplasmic protein n=1 Tax=Chitinivorax sp. B TaxID=2502235 RepID=UPI00148579D1|nr:transporter substrate-binding domain-containing protein [Chitinivorax sp. B]